MSTCKTHYAVCPCDSCAAKRLDEGSWETIRKLHAELRRSIEIQKAVDKAILKLYQLNSK